MGSGHRDADPPLDSLPETDWEVAERRTSIPEDLRQLFGKPVSAIRVPKSVHEKIVTKHQNVLADYQKLESRLENWESYRVVNGRWEIYMPERENGDRLMAIIGMDKTGSINLVSLYLVRRRNWRNRTLIPRRIEK
ncbi:MAG: hypothetical protein M3457_00295 [Chloroflexota bacterium]|nr:hypothetical protein [Chloroflexota bacterium]